MLYGERGTEVLMEELFNQLHQVEMPSTSKPVPARHRPSAMTTRLSRQPHASAPTSSTSKPPTPTPSSSTISGSTEATPPGNWHRHCNQQCPFNDILRAIRQLRSQVRSHEDYLELHRLNSQLGHMVVKALNQRFPNWSQDRLQFALLVALEVLMRIVEQGRFVYDDHSDSISFLFTAAYGRTRVGRTNAVSRSAPPPPAASGSAWRSSQPAPRTDAGGAAHESSSAGTTHRAATIEEAAFCAGASARVASIDRFVSADEDAPDFAEHPAMPYYYLAFTSMANATEHSHPI